MDRKRQRPAASAENLQQQQLEEPPVEARSTKYPKLILKPPKFLTAKQRRHEPRQEFSSLLEDMLDLETGEEVVEHLLRLMDTCRVQGTEDRVQGGGEDSSEGMNFTEEISKCLSALVKLAKSHRENISVCCVLVHALELLVVHWKVRLGGSLPKNVQTFVLSLLDHGEPTCSFFFIGRGFRLVKHSHTVS